MSLGSNILMRAFGCPKGVLGRLGGAVMARGNREMARRAIGLLDVQPGDRVLEIGFGPGVGIQLLAGTVSTGRVAGIDLSEEMVRQATERNRSGIEAGVVELRQGSVERLPYESAAFDKALAINSMQLWPDAVAGLREAMRVLRPKGSIALGFTRHSGQGKDGLTDTLTTAGFVDARVIDVDGEFCVLAAKPGKSGEAVDR